MKSLILSILMIIAVTGAGQITKTTTKEIGKVGKLIFEAFTTITGSDTVISYSIREKTNIWVPNVSNSIVINKNELKEVAETLLSFVPEFKKKNPGNMTTFSHKTKDSIIISCSYQKIAGWMVMIQNTNKEVESVSDRIEWKTGYSLNQFIQIDPMRVEGVAKLLNKISDGN